MTEVVLVTGGASGIGAAVARNAAAKGMRVAICDINEPAGSRLAEELAGRYLPCDVTEPTSVEAAVSGCCEELGTPRYVHLNAGVMTVPAGEPFLAIEAVTEAQYRRIVGVNLDGVYHGLKSLLPRMRDAGGGITITASTAGLTMVPVDPMYTATKYALVGLGRAVAAANEGSSVRVNVICPGVVDTAIVPDEYRKPEFNVMPAEVMAEEIVDLMLKGANGEVRVKVAQATPAFSVEPLSLQY